MRITETKAPHEGPPQSPLSQEGAAGSCLKATVVEQRPKAPVLVDAATTQGKAPTRDLAAGPLRVLHVINSLGLGGTERGVLKVMEGLDPERFDQWVCTVRGAGPELQDHPAVRGKLLTIANGDHAGFQFLTPRLASIFRKHRPHIVHSRNWGGIEAAPAAKLAGVSVVVHSEHGYELDMMTGLPLRRRVMRRAFYSMCDALFTVSRELRDFHCRHGWIRPERIQVIPNGVDTELFAVKAEVRHRLREQFQFRPGSVVLGSVGRLVAIKAHETLLRAAEKLIASGIDVRVLLVGGGPELEGLRNHASQSASLRDRVTFVGSSLAVHELYQAMDVFVLPSIQEGMSNTLLEAMASGLPCVATAVGGNTELVADGRSGFLFTPQDVAGLVRALQPLAQEADLRAKFALAARQQAVTSYSLDRMIRAYNDLYSGLAKKSGLTTRN